MAYAGVWFLLFAVTALFNVLPNPLSVLTLNCPAFLYVVPVAVCAHFGQWKRTAGLIAGALLAVIAGVSVLLLVLKLRGYSPGVQLTSGQIAGLAAMSAVNATIVAAMGLPIGAGTARGWTYGRIVAITMTGFCLIAGAYLALSWNAFDRVINSMIEALKEQLNQNATEMGPDLLDRQMASLKWFSENKPAMAVGIEFAMYLAMTCVLVSLTTTALRRRYAEPGPASSFREMQPPDWLVWVAIATAVAWFADYHYGVVALRIVTWNVAIALAAIYLLNGWAIFLYAVHVLAPNIYLVGIVALFITITGQAWVFGLVGFFDTWANFRRRMDRLAEAIRSAKSGKS